MLWFAAAASAPARILSQNVSPGASWVTIAMVKLSPSAAAPPPSFWAPPSLLHAASVTVAALTATTACSDLRVLLMHDSRRDGRRAGGCGLPRTRSTTPAASFVCLDIVTC